MAAVPGERRFCGLGNHLLKTPHTPITDSKVLTFALNINPELRRASLICMDCHDVLVKIYKYKIKNALEHRKRRDGDTVSDVSTIQREDVSSSSDPSVNSFSDPSLSTSSRMRVLATATAKATANEAAAKAMANAAAANQTTPIEDDTMHTTSAVAAAEKRKRTPPPPQRQSNVHPSRRSTGTDDDDANSNLSLNAVNGTRLPHIQPIPKRRQTVHLNKEAMDIYLAGTTGG